MKKSMGFQNTYSGRVGSQLFLLWSYEAKAFLKSSFQRSKHHCNILQNTCFSLSVLQLRTKRTSSLSGSVRQWTRTSPRRWWMLRMVIHLHTDGEKTWWSSTFAPMTLTRRLLSLLSTPRQALTSVCCFQVWHGHQHFSLHWGHNRGNIRTPTSRPPIRQTTQVSERRPWPPSRRWKVLQSQALATINISNHINQPSKPFESKHATCSWRTKQNM